MNLIAMNTRVKIDLKSVPWSDKNELLQTTIDLNIFELTKLEVKFNKLQKAHEALKKQIDTQNIKLKATNNNVATLKATLANVPIMDILGKKDALIKEKDAELNKKDVIIKEKRKK